MKIQYRHLLLGVLIGVAAFGGIKNQMYTYEKAVLSESIREEMNIGEFEIAIVSSSKSDSVDMNVYTKWWYHEGEDCYYLFLPGHWDAVNGRRLYWGFSNVEEVLLDGKKICNGDLFNIEAGSHTINASGDEYNLMVMYSSDIGSLFIQTESKSLAYIHESKENVESAQYILYSEDGRLSNSGIINEMSCRGNVSFTDREKKSYHLDMLEKSQMLDLGAEKDWLLLANGFDESLSRNWIVNNMAKALSMEYVPDAEYIDLYINGDYVGNYLLTEKIEVGSERVNIRDLDKELEVLNPGLDFSTCEIVIEQPGKLFSRKWWKIPNEPDDYTGGYLMEIDWSDRYGGEESGFISSRMQPVVVRSPKYATLNQIGYMADIYQDFEDAAFSETGYNEKTEKYFYEYIDMESFTVKYMLEELVKNQDASYTSFFLYKPEYDTKMYAGPVWDYDGAIHFERVSDEGIDLGDPEGLYAAVEKRDGDIWYALYKQPYFRDNIASICDAWFEETVNEFVEIQIDANAERIMESAVMTSIRWDRFDADSPEEMRVMFAKENTILKEFLQERMAWLSEEWNYERQTLRN